MSAEPPADARQKAAVCHLSAAAGLVVPLGAVLGPVMAWIVFKEEDAFVDQQGRHAVDVNLAFLVLELVAAAVIAGWAFMGLFGRVVVAPAIFLVVGLVGLAHVIVVLYAAIKVSEGHDVHVPFRIPVLGD